jgi:hypothetical protein
MMRGDGLHERVRPAQWHIDADLVGAEDCVNERVVGGRAAEEAHRPGVQSISHAPVFSGLADRSMPSVRVMDRRSLR